MLPVKGHGNTMWKARGYQQAKDVDITCVYTRLYNLCVVLLNKLQDMPVLGKISNEESRTLKHADLRSQDRFTG